MPTDGPGALALILERLRSYNGERAWQFFDPDRDPDRWLRVLKSYPDASRYDPPRIWQAALAHDPALLDLLEPLACPIALIWLVRYQMGRTPTPCYDLSRALSGALAQHPFPPWTPFISVQSPVNVTGVYRVLEETECASPARHEMARWLATAVALLLGQE